MKKTSKVLIMIRTSTEKQSIDNQHYEMVEFCKQRGYLEENMVFIEEQGASAVKMDDRYKAQIEAIKEAIKMDENIDCFACWHLNRAFRNEEAYLDLKSFMVPRKIQMLVKNPSLELLNYDGTINKGMELAMGLFAILNKQEDEERKEKFKRTKRGYALSGKYNGGNTKKFGYKINENGFFVIDEEESKTVKLIFELYSQGNYSCGKLKKELDARGVNITKQQIQHILKSDAYCGRPQIKYNNRVYPPIISMELFDKCGEIRENNKLNIRKENNICLSGGLIKCSVCGGSFSSNGKYYSCCRHAVQLVCDNTITINKDVIDGILWMVASMLHIKYIVEEGEENLKAFQEQLVVYDQKINTALNKIEKIDEKKDRVLELYIEGAIDSENKAARLLKIQEEYKSLTQELKSLEEAKNRLYGLIRDIENKDKYNMVLNTIDEITDEDLEYKYDIIHKYITKVLCYREWYGKIDKRATKENGIRIDVYTIDDKITTYMYIPNGKGERLFIKKSQE